MKNLVRGSLPPEMFREYLHLKVDLGRTTDEMVVESFIVLLRYHGRGEGLPEPMPPVEGGAR